MVHGGERRSSSIRYCEIQPSEAPRLPNEAVICITEPTDAACGAVYWSAVGTERVVDIEAASTPPAKRVVPDEDWRAAITVKQVLIGIQDLLDNPNPNSPAQADAYHLFISDKGEYERRVKQVAAQNPAP